MAYLKPNVDKKQVTWFIVSNTADGTLSDEFNRSSFLGARAAGVAQQMRQALVGDAATTTRLFEAGKLNDPVGHLAAQIESAHLQLAMTRNRVGLAAFSGGDPSHHVDKYIESLLALFELHNQGVGSLPGLIGKANELMVELLEPLHEELVHANRVYRKRFLGLF